MADKKSLMENIKEDVSKIRESKFGTKLPGNENKQTEQTEQELSYEQAIMATLGSLTWGTNKKTPNEILNQLNDTNIFNLVESIKDNLDKTINKDAFQNVKLKRSDIQLLSRSISFNLNDPISDLKSSIDELDIFLNNYISNDQTSNLLNIAQDLKTTAALQKETAKNLVSSSEEIKNYFNGNEFKKNFENKLEINITGSSNLTDVINQLENFNDNDIVSQFKKLDKIIERIEKYKFDKDSFKGLSDLKNFLNSIASLSNDKKLINIKDNLNAFNEQIFANNGELRAIFENISNILDDPKIKNIDKDISNINSVLQTLITVISIDSKSINLKGLRTLLSISDSKHGLIKKLIENLKTITVDITINNDAFDAINAFFEAMTEIGNIGLFKRALIKSNIKYFINFIGEEIPKLIDEIKKSEGKVINAETVNSIAVIGSIFESLSKIGELKFKDKIRMKINLMYIRYFILNDVVNILKDIISEFNKITPEAFKSIEELNKLFDKLIELSKTSVFKLLKLSFTFNMLEDIIRNQLIGDKEEGTGLLIAIASLDNKLLNNILLRLKKLETLFDSLSTIISNEDLSLKNTLLFILKLNVFIQSIDFIKKIIDKIKKLDGRTLNSIINKTEKLDIIFGHIGNINIDPMRSLLLLPALTVTVFNVKLISKILNNLNNINIDTKKVENIIILVSTLLKLKGRIRSAKTLNKSLDAIIKSTDKIKEICENIKDIDAEYDLEKTKAIIGTFNDILIKAAAVLIIGALAMKFVSPQKLIIFAITLGTFLWGITKIFSSMSKELDKTIEISKDAINLVLISGGILILGGLVMNFIHPAKLFIFALTLGVFILMVTSAYYIMSKANKEAFIGAKSFAKLIAISALTLIAGAIFVKSGLILEALGFAVILSVFIFGVTFIYKLASRNIRNALFTASHFALLIAVSAGVLIVGSLFMTNLRMVIGALSFAIILGVFIWGILSVIKSSARHIKTAIATMISISILISIAAATLLIGGLLMTLIPNLGKNILYFGLILTGFIAAIAVICVLLKLAKKWIEPGIIVLGGIIVLIGLSAIALGLVSMVSLLMYAIGYDKIFNGLGIIVLVVIGMSIICGIIGIPYIALAVGIGIVVMLGMTVLLIAMSFAIAALVTVLKYAATIKEEELETLFGKDFFSYGTIGHAIIGLIKLTPAFLALEVAAALMMPGIITVFTLCGALSMMAFTIKQWADLRIPVYDSNGKVSGYRTLDSDDFNKALENIGKTVTTLFEAIQKVYNEGKGTGIFDLDWSLSTFLTGKTPAQRVISSSMQLGKMLSNLAQGIKAWAKLKIPEYGSDGKSVKIIGYKTIDKSEFVTAGENIKAVLIALGTAIIETYERNPGMFESNEWLGLGNTPFAKVTKAMKTMGPMLSSIAKGVQMWADLKIPVYGKDKNGNATIVNYERLDGTKLKAAQEKITEVITALANGVIQAYNTNKDNGMFDDDSWHGFGDSPFARVTKAMKTMGPMLSSIAKGVQMWADLRIPIYGKDKDGRATIVDYKRLRGDDLTKASETIALVTKTLAQGIIDVYEENKDSGMFDDDSWHGFGDSPFATVTKSMKTMGGALNNIADAVQAWAELKIPIYGDPKDKTKITDYKTIDDGVFTKVADHIKYVVTTLARSIAELAADETYGKYFKDTDHWWESDTPVAKVLKSIQPMGSALKDIADAIFAWSTLNVPEYDPKSKDPLKPVGYHKITDGEITKAKANIGDVVKTLIIGVAKIYDSPIEGSTDTMQKYFDEGSGWLGTGLFKGDSPIAKVLNSIVPVGKALKDIADAVKSWSELKIPIYGKNSIEPIGYMSIGGEEGIKTATDNIKKVLRAIVFAVANTYYGEIVLSDGSKKQYSELFKDGKDGIIGNITESMIKMGNLIKTVAEGVSSIVALKIPIYDSKGKVKAYHNIENGNFKQVGDVIKNVLTAIGNAIIDVSANENINPNKNPMFSIAVESIKASTDILGSIASVVGNFASGKFTLYEIKKNKLVPTQTIDINNETTKENIKNNIITIVSIIGDALNEFIGSESKFKNLINEETNKSIIDTKTAIINLITNIGEIYGKIGELNKTFVDNQKSLEEFVKTSEEQNFEGQYVIKVNLDKLIKCINDISSSIIDDNTLKNNLNSFVNNKDSFVTGINAVHIVITNLIKVLANLANINNKVKGAQFGNIKDIIGRFTKEIEDIKNNIYKSTKISENELEKIINNAKNIVTLLTEFTKIIQLSNSLGKQSFDTLSEGISTIYLTISNVGDENNLTFNAHMLLINDYISTINKVDNVVKFNEKINTLKDGILNINNIVNEITNKNDFAKHINDLEKYIKIINSINLTKFNSMKGLVDAMNKLSAGMNGLDKLTDAIANKLSAVLYELVNQLTKADTSINNAHELQEKRKKLIEESIGKIESIMSQHMIVEIQQSSDENKESGKGGGGYIDGEKTDNSTPTGSDTESKETYNKLDSPENAEADKQESNLKAPWQKNQQSRALTLEEFTNEMKNRWVKEIANQIKFK